MLHQPRFFLKIRGSIFSPSKKLDIYIYIYFLGGSGIRAIMGFQQTSFTSTTAISRHLSPEPQHPSWKHNLSFFKNQKKKHPWLSDWLRSQSFSSAKNGPPSHISGKTSQGLKIHWQKTHQNMHRSPKWLSQRRVMKTTLGWAPVI